MLRSDPCYRVDCITNSMDMNLSNLLEMGGTLGDRGDRGVWQDTDPGVAELDTTEQQNNSSKYKIL